MKIKEDILHYVWRMKLVDIRNLLTTTGHTVVMDTWGHHNHNAGPDFLEARLTIDGVNWAGHIEMHVNSSDWYRHGHQKDPAYDNVILHVVYEDDQPVYRLNGEQIPCLSIKRRISTSTMIAYNKLMAGRRWVPCVGLISSVEPITIVAAQDKMLSERLADKAQKMGDDLKSLDGDFHALIYQKLAYGLGLKVNAESMEILARSLPYNIVQRHRDNILQLEALLFGQSGLLPLQSDDAYVNTLQKEYDILQVKYNLVPMRAVQWKFSRMRPASFPTIRIAQLAQLLHQMERVDDALFSEDHLTLLKHLVLSPGGYWLTHYRFNKVAAPRNKSVGKATIDLILINVVAPLLFMYGQIRGSQDHKDKAVQLLDDIAAEKNAITKGWAALGIPCDNASQSQAMIHLKRVYCDHFKCLSCPIGHHVMRTSSWRDAT